MADKVTVDSDYEKDMESTWAMIALEEEVKKSKDRQKSRSDLLDFLNTHPDFKQYYSLLKAVDRY